MSICAKIVYQNPNVSFDSYEKNNNTASGRVASEVRHQYTRFCIASYSHKFQHTVVLGTAFLIKDMNYKYQLLSLFIFLNKIVCVCIYMFFINKIR